MVAILHYFWSSWGHYYGHTTYDAAIGGNQNIAWNSYYYYPAANPPGYWVRGQKVAGKTDPATTIAWASASMPTAIRNNANMDGTPKPHTVSVQATAGAIASGSMAGANAGHSLYDSNPKYHRLMQVGVMDGADILWVQNQLGMAGPGGISGDGGGHFGNTTKWYVVNYQKRAGLVADGIVGNKTACKLGMNGATGCTGGVVKPTNTGGTGSVGGNVSTPAPAAAPTPPPPPPKPNPPYKLPKYIASFQEPNNFNPIAANDLVWAEWGVFNAYELANVAHNQYFQAVPPQYNVLANMHTTLTAMDQSKYLMDESILKSFADPPQEEDYETLAFGVAKPGDPTIYTDRSLVYIASRITATNKELQRRLVAVKFLAQDIWIPIDDNSYHITWISRRIGAGAGSNYEPILASVTHSNNTLTVSWTSNPYADYYIVYTTQPTPTQTGQLSKSTNSWTTGALAPNTTQCFVVKAFKSITDINNITTDFIVGSSIEQCDTVPQVLIPDPASFTYLRAIAGYTSFVFALPANTANFDHVRVVMKPGSWPTHPGDGDWRADLYAGSAGQLIQGSSVGQGARPDTTYYLAMWTYNSIGQASPTVQTGSVFFLHSPIEVWPVAKDSWRTVYSTSWESCCNRMRASNYCDPAQPSVYPNCTQSGLARYTGLWFYNGGLRQLGGRNVVASQILVNRHDGGSMGPIPAHIGNHNYPTHPANNNEPAMYNVQQTPETVARDSSRWIPLTRYNGNFSRDEIEGLGMYRRTTDLTDDWAWVGAEVANDGVVQIFHTDYAS